MSADSSMRPSEFLTLLWGVTPPGLIQLWQLDGKQSYYLRGPAQADYYAADKVDVYCGVGLAHADHGRKFRAKADQIIAIAGLWLDIDIDGPGRKHVGVPDRDAALGLAYELAPPTVIIDSGYGLHGWWLFDEGPWHFASRDEQQAAARASEQWYALHRQRAQRQGWGVDHTHDLARILRPPGTLNGKHGTTTPVTVAEHAGHSYPREWLLALAATAGPVDSPPIGGVAQMQLSAGTPSELPVGTRIAALVANDDMFRDTWRCERADGGDWSMSEYNLSLAAQLVAADWTDPDLREAIRIHRLRHDAGDTKGRRLDYLDKTIAKARERHSRETALAELRDTGQTRAAA